MDLSSPLRSLVPSLDSAVLEVLAGTESGLSASAIRRLAPRGSRTGQAAVLDRLVTHGLVTADPANQGYLYRLNRRHVLADAVLQVVAARAEVLRRLTRAVTVLQPAPVHASVFGSFARREATSASDIDLLLVIADTVDPYTPTWQDQLHHLEDDVRAWTGNTLESLVRTRSELRRLAEVDEPIVATWLDEALLLQGDPLAALLADRSAPSRPRAAAAHS